MAFVLAADLGATHLRAALIDARGSVAAEATVKAPRDRGGEIAASAWWDGFVALCAQLETAAPAAFAAVAGVAICGLTRTQVFLDAAGDEIRPALTWTDSRAAAMAAAIGAAAAASGHPEAAQINAFHPLARLCWLRAAEPAAFARLAVVLEPKDYLNARLTGRAASDRVSLARLLAAAAPGPEGGADLLAAQGLARHLLPALREPWEAIGAARGDLPAPLGALASRPVFCAANDTWAAVLGLGAMRSGHAYNISGTSEVLGVVDGTARAAEGLLTVDWRGLFQLGGPGQNGADCIAWLAGLLGRPAPDAAWVAAQLAAPAHPQPLLFLPYLRGERVPHWDPALRGAFVGLARDHGPGDLLRAVLEGVAFVNRLVLERAEAALGHPVAEIRFGGGGAAHPAWRQIKADICGRPVVTGAAAEPGLLGAALLAWTGLGRFASLAAAQAALVAVAERRDPDPRRAGAYDGLYALFRSADAALAPISRALAGDAARWAARAAPLA